MNIQSDKIILITLLSLPITACLTDTIIGNIISVVWGVVFVSVWVFTSDLCKELLLRVK